MVLTPALLDALPAVLRSRRELRALRHAVTHERDGRDDYLQALAWNLPRMARLDPLLAAARARGLKLVPIKGALLARTHYGDLGARPMVDVDVVCAPEEIEATVALCVELGFRRLETPQFRSARDAVHDVRLVDGAVTLELHHRLWHELRIDRAVAGLLARAQLVPFGAATTWAPSDADHLYVVLVHAALHGFAGNPLWLTDAALLAAGAGPRVWPEVEALAQAAGARLPLTAARDQLAAALPVPGARPNASDWPIRRVLLQRLSPWLQRGEETLGPWPSRIVRPLLFERARDLGGWALEKLAMLRATSRQPQA